jgi:hypothetical protein
MLGTTGAERSTNQTTCHATCGDLSNPFSFRRSWKYFSESALSEVQLRPHGKGGVTGQIAPRQHGVGLIVQQFLRGRSARSPHTNALHPVGGAAFAVPAAPMG